jgi:hypothetical protein
MKANQQDLYHHGPRAETKGSAALVAAVAEGKLTPSEASELAKLIDTCVRSIEATEFEERLVKLEQAQQS